MNVKKIIAALSLSLCATAAFADDFTVNAGTLPISPTAPYAHVFTHEVGNFSDVLNFDIAAGTLVSSANPLNLMLAGTNVYNISSLTYEVWQGQGIETVSYGTFSGNNSTNTVQLTAPGPYHLRLNGIADGSAGGAYGVALTTAVPEPETYGMLLAGIGLLGVAARRKAKSDSNA